MISRKHFLRGLLGFLILSPFVISVARAEDMTSMNFIIRDPVAGTTGGYGTSLNFNLIYSGETLFTDINSSLNFIGHYGFLYYPFADSGILSVTPAGLSANLSWTATNAGLGFVVSAYEVGKSTTSGGPYTYTNVGLVTSSVQGGLSSGVSYYFVVRTLDAFGNPISISNQISYTATVGGGGGGGGGGSGGVGVIQPPSPPSPSYPTGECRIADFNCDGFVNIEDLSILLYYFDKEASNRYFYDLSEDGLFDIQDISIMFYYWDI